MSGISVSTFLLIAFGEDSVRPSSMSTEDGRAIPVIERRHGEAWWPLVTWDANQLPPAEAETFARRFIEAVREEATKKPPP